jgi:glyoxylate reductase
MNPPAPRVLLTSPLAADVRTWLPPALADVVPLAAGTALGDAIATAEGLICLLSDPVDAALLARAPRLRVIGNHAVGFDNVDVAEATRRGVVVCNTPDVLTDATADLTLALLLAAVRRLPEAESLVRAGGWTGWSPTQLLGGDLAGRTLGLIGFGRIGQAVARRARGFGLHIIYYARTRAAADLEAQLGATWTSMDDLVSRSDFVSLHCPLTAETRGIIDGPRLARMKPDAFLVNTARGACVDEDALAAALEAGHLGGAALDVYSEEPRIPARLLRAPRTLLLPHIGSATRGARARMAELCARGVAAVLRGERPANVVNPEVFASGGTRAS